MVCLEGLPVSAGIARGRALWYRPHRPAVGQGTYGDTAELRFRRYCDALEEAKTELKRLARRLEREGSGRADVVYAQSALLDDPTLMEEIRTEVETKQTDAAVDAVYRKYAQLLEEAADPQIRARAADYRDMGRRVLRVLEGGTAMDLSALTQPCIVVAEELPPSEAAALDREHVLGIVTVRGGEASHTAIIARSYGIPAVLGVSGLRAVQPGDTLILDARAPKCGRVWIRPEETVLARFQQEETRWKQEQSVSQSCLCADPRTKDGERVSIRLNLDGVDGETLAYAPHVDGSGLFRTEFLYLDRTQAPTEEEQYQRYRQVLEAFDGRPVVLRTMDIGGDKQLPYLEPGQEANPFLGLRGLRRSLRQPELFRTQLRAALRAGSHGELRLMFPMVTGLEEIDQARAIVQSVQEELRAEGCAVGDVQLGVMIEVPGLALLADLVAQRVDFASIGTNDLCQYLLAADRTDPAVANCYQSLHPAVLRLISHVADAFAREGKELSLCGELASDPLATELLVGLGLRKLSVNGRAVGPVKRQVAAFTLEQAQETARMALALSTAEDIRDHLTKRQTEATEVVSQNDDHSK